MARRGLALISVMVYAIGFVTRRGPEEAREHLGISRQELEVEEELGRSH